MIVVAPTVESNKPELHELFDLGRRWVDHANNGLTLSRNFPVDQEEIRKHFDIIKYNLIIGTLPCLRRLGRFKWHFVYQFDTIISLMRATCRKR